MFNQESTERILSVVHEIRNEAERAENKFDRDNSEIQRKASHSIDLFGGKTTSRVADIARDARRACDDLYSAYQSLLRIADEQCRPLLEENPSLVSVREVRDLIKWLNDESEIENNFTASFNNMDLGDLSSARHIPSIDSKMIQHYWENKYSMWPGRAELEAEESRQEEELERRQEEARRVAQAEKVKRREAENAEYEKLYREWESKKRTLEEQCRIVVEKELDSKVKELHQKVDQRYQSVRSTLLGSMNEAEGRKKAAEVKLTNLGFFAFGEKNECKKIVREMTVKIAELESKLVAAENEYDAEKRDIPRKTEDLRAKLYSKTEKKYPIPPKPRKPHPDLFTDTSGLSAQELANLALEQAILDFMEPDTLYTITEIVENCPECQDFTNQRVSALVRQLIPTYIERVERNRMGYFRLA